MFNRHENLKEYINRYPMTSAIISINILIYIVGYMGKITNLNMLEVEKFAMIGIENNEYYRLLTSMFFHGSFMHILFNIFTLYVFCCEYEKKIGSFKFIITYFVCGFGSGIFVWIFSPEVYTIGASGAIFGIFGAFLVYMYKNKNYINKEAKKILTIIVIFNLISTFISSGVSISGHIGGFLTGIILASFIKK